MGLKWAVATGNWSDGATWNDGIVPGANDDVFADGKTVTIDQNIAARTLRTTQRLSGIATGGTAGGSFTCSTTRSVTLSNTNMSNPSIVAEGLYIPGTNGQTITVSNNTAYNFSTTHEFEFEITCEQVTGTAGTDRRIFARRAANSSYNQFDISVANTGYMRFRCGNSVTSTWTVTATAGMVTNNRERWKIIADPNVGGNLQVTFYRHDGTSFVQQYQEQVAWGRTSFSIQSTTDPSIATSGTDAFFGTIHRIIWRNGVDGPVVFDANFEAAPEQQVFTSMIESSSVGATVTNGNQGSKIQGTVPGSTSVLTFTGAAGTTLTVNGEIRGADGTGSVGVLLNGLGTVTINGNLTGGTGGYAATCSSTGTLNAYGNLISSTSNSGGGGISMSAAATVNVTGNIPGNGGNNTAGLLASGANANITVTGTVRGTGNGFAGIHATVTCTITVIGDVTGSTLAAGGSGISLSTNSTNQIVSVTGNVTSSITGTSGISSGGTSSGRTITVIGTVTSVVTSNGNVGTALYDINASGGRVIVGGSLIDSDLGDSAVCARRFSCIPTLNTIRSHIKDDGYPPTGARFIYASSDYVPSNIPSPADVRSGTVYNNSTQTGTMVIPAANQVAAGALVDNTVGTASLGIDAFARLVAAIITASTGSYPA